MNKTANLISKFLVFSLVVIIAMGGATSCKSKKKIAREKAAAEYAAKVEQAKKDLNAILNDETTWTLDEKKARLATIKSYNIDDQEVKDLIVKVEEKLKEEERQAEEERLRKEEMEKRKKEQGKYATINNAFAGIASSTDYDDANRKIDAALSLFETPDVPVLVIISQENGQNDYDRPTTISKFLNYLKDKKQFKFGVENVEYNNQGKIKLLELIKK